MSGSLVVIGNFDGVHRGHQAVLHAVARIAKARGLAPRLLTFDPHPAVTLGRRAPALLTGLERKRQLVDRACPGIEVVVREFTRDFASQTPEQFAEQVLRHELDTRLVMVGSNFRFGRGRSGGIHDLERLGRELGFDTMARISPVVGSVTTQGSGTAHTVYAPHVEMHSSGTSLQNSCSSHSVEQIS